MLYENFHIIRPHYHLKVIGHILKNKEKSHCVFIHETIQLIIMKMKMKMKNRSYRYDLNRPRSRHDMDINIVNIRRVSL